MSPSLVSIHAYSMTLEKTNCEHHGYNSSPHRVELRAASLGQSGRSVTTTWRRDCGDNIRGLVVTTSSLLRGDDLGNSA